jgi:hypothetical protein
MHPVRHSHRLRARSSSHPLPLRHSWFDPDRLDVPADCDCGPVIPHCVATGSSRHLSFSDHCLPNLWSASDDLGPVRLFLVEYTAGKAIGSNVVPRSSRTIVRFAASELEHDSAFDQISVQLAAESGGGIVCGFNGLPSHKLDGQLDYAAEIAKAWKARGLELIHLELGYYQRTAKRDRVLAAIGPIVTSMGMSLAELIGLLPDTDPVQKKAMRLGNTFGLSRVCVHADEWAMVLTRSDVQREREALMMGSLLASSRAATGYVGVPRDLPERARFIDPPFPAFEWRKRVEDYLLSNALHRHTSRDDRSGRHFSRGYPSGPERQYPCFID